MQPMNISEFFTDTFAVFGHVYVNANMRIDVSPRFDLIFDSNCARHADSSRWLDAKGEEINVPLFTLSRDIGSNRE